VPFAAGIEKLVAFVAIVPLAVPLNRKRRLGYVWPRTEEKYRWPIGKCWASA